ncbi:Tn3 family transposase [Kitasatospora sp. NPDC050543]|uniref:Tn3 family transposase n=1 Tax=Kitasatospora sp. NPDC050543 TaxID=3364054 RepID=UPI00379977DE
MLDDELRGCGAEPGCEFVEGGDGQAFTSLLTNLVIFHNTLDIAEAVCQLQSEGWSVEPQDLAQISPYLTEHIKRFGEYSTHELAVAPENYDSRLDVDFSVLGEEEVVAA